MRAATVRDILAVLARVRHDAARELVAALGTYADALALGEACGQCDAEPGEPCRPMCTGQAAQDDRREAIALPECEHWERESPSFHGHCSHASCPNYMNSCPVHSDIPAGRPGGRIAGAACTLEP